jgi:hypothetical protein
MHFQVIHHSEEGNLGIAFLSSPAPHPSRRPQKFHGPLENVSDSGHFGILSFSPSLSHVAQ